MWRDLHPAWKVCIGLGIVLFITFAAASKILFTQQQSINRNERLLFDLRQQHELAEERSYINRAISGCADIINDQEIELTEECLDPNVVAYYPPSICEKLPVEIEICGSKAVVVSEGEP